MTDLEKLMETTIGAGIIKKMAELCEYRESEIRWSIQTMPAFRQEFLATVARVTEACKNIKPDFNTEI